MLRLLQSSWSCVVVSRVLIVVLLVLSASDDTFIAPVGGGMLGERLELSMCEEGTGCIKNALRLLDSATALEPNEKFPDLDTLRAFLLNT